METSTKGSFSTVSSPSISCSSQPSTSEQTLDVPQKSTLSPTQKENNNNKNNTHSFQPIAWLSAMWFGLCACLVHKYNDLIGVFFAFVGSFVLAYLLSTETESFTTSFPTATATATASTVGLDPATRNAHTRTKGMVGLSLSLISLSFLGVNRDFQALSTMTGYLAFDLWFTSLYCQPIPPPILSMLEDAMFLTFFLVSLSLYANRLASCHGYILGWVIYKTVMFLIQWSTHGPSAAASAAAPAAVVAETITVQTQHPQHQHHDDDDDDHSTITHTPHDKTNNSNDNDNVWTVHGMDYDLTKFVLLHPGGKEAVELGRGRDCTALFESYHPFTNKHRLVLHKYQLDLTPKKSSNQDDKDPFYDILKKRVAATLQEQGIDPEQQRTATPLRVAYYALIAACLFVSGYAHVKGSFIGSFLFGVFGWLIGALGHDAGHFAAFRTPLLNDMGVWAMSWLCNPIMWQHQHTFAHHSHTNEFDKDPDLHHFHLLLRVHRRVQQEEMYKLQRNWIFVMFAYTFVTFGTCIWIPIDMLKTGFLYGIVEWTNKKRPLAFFGMLLHMAAYVVVIMICPFFSSSSWYKALASVIVHIWTTGLLFGVFSQINHLNEASLDSDVKTRKEMTKKRSPLIQNSWAAAQVETSNNFAPNSQLWHILSNGLNLQIEHHLFPSLNHSHLYRIAPVVEQTCREYGVQYKCYRSWPEIMRATFRWLDQLAPPSSSSLPPKV